MKATNSIDFPRLNIFLKNVDSVTEIFGLNVPTLVKLEAIENLPPGTLGKSLAEFLEENQLKPFTTGSRRKQLHDCIHVISGYDSSPLGEAEVQAFLLGSKFNLPNLLLLSGIKARMKRKIGAHSEEYQFAKQRLLKAYERGQNSNLDPDKWQPELMWDYPLKVVRLAFKID